MSPETFKEYQQKLGLSQAKLSRLLGFKDDGETRRSLSSLYSTSNHSRVFKLWAAF